MYSTLAMFALQFTTTNLVLWGVVAVLFFAIIARRRSRQKQGKQVHTK
jgi:hypothetical protein